MRDRLGVGVRRWTAQPADSRWPWHGALCKPWLCLVCAPSAGAQSDHERRPRAPSSAKSVKRRGGGKTGRQDSRSIDLAHTLSTYTEH
eukprot:scaffold26093_cov66-Phaeocystis_antarctica.AAC.4